MQRVAPLRIVRLESLGSKQCGGDEVVVESVPYLVPVLCDDVWLRYRWGHGQNTGCRLGVVLVIVVFVVVDADADADNGGRGRGWWLNVVADGVGDRGGGGDICRAGSVLVVIVVVVCFGRDREEALPEVPGVVVLVGAKIFAWCVVLRGRRLMWGG